MLSSKAACPTAWLTLRQGVLGWVQLLLASLPLIRTYRVPMVARAVTVLITVAETAGSKAELARIWMGLAMPAGAMGETVTRTLTLRLSPAASNTGKLLLGSTSAQPKLSLMRETLRVSGASPVFCSTWVKVTTSPPLTS
jgi:hypothetical protein